MKHIGFGIGIAVYSLCLIVFALLAATLTTAYDADYYHSFQEKNHIMAITGKSQEELDRISGDLIEYMRDGKEERMTAHFGERETAHMRDVFGLFHLARIVSVLTAGIVFFGTVWILFRKKYKQAFRAVLIFGGVTFLLLLIVSIAAAIDWDTSFTVFHKILFKNDLWLLNPDSDLLIQMMPMPFFVGMGIRIAVKTLVLIGADLILFALFTHFDRSAQRKKEDSCLNIQATE
ncbi:TIGR01906 family membrane protein [Peptoniphilaceae bacterium SGI.137]|nr:TIGR01906 family membrane protein [Peptoniphilaceae bacterium]